MERKARVVHGKILTNLIPLFLARVMSLHPQKIGNIPPDTIRVAQAAFRSGNIYLRMRDEARSFLR